MNADRGSGICSERRFPKLAMPVRQLFVSTIEHLGRVIDGRECAVATSEFCDHGFVSVDLLTGWESHRSSPGRGQVFFHVVSSFGGLNQVRCVSPSLRFWTSCVPSRQDIVDLIDQLNLENVSLEDRCATIGKLTIQLASDEHGTCQSTCCDGSVSLRSLVVWNRWF